MTPTCPSCNGELQATVRLHLSLTDGCAWEYDDHVDHAAEVVRLYCANDCDGAILPSINDDDADGGMVLTPATRENMERARTAAWERVLGAMLAPAAVTPVVLCIRDPDASNEYVTDGEARIIDVDLGSGFDAGNLSERDRADVEEYARSWLASVNDLPSASAVRRRVEGLALGLLKEVGSDLTALREGGWS